MSSGFGKEKRSCRRVVEGVWMSSRVPSRGSVMGSTKMLDMEVGFTISLGLQGFRVEVVVGFRFSVRHQPESEG